ncbi:MAG: pitrilysin family protein [Pseudomonadota bacterium]
MIRVAVATCLALAAALPLRAEVDIIEVETPGGINAWLVEEPSIPFVALEVMFRGGTSLDDPEKRGAIHLMAALLEEGAGDMNAQAFARAREDLAAGISFSVYDDGLDVSARFLTETMDDVTELLRTAINEPRFDDDAIERVRAQVLSGLRSDLESPNTIAGQAMSAALFGDHIYGSSGDGTIESVTALTRDDLVDAHGRVFARDKIYAAAVGDITEDQLAALLDAILGDLPETSVPLTAPVEMSFWGDVQVIDYPTPQAVIRFAQPGIARDDPDFFAAFVMSQVLGAGGFESRLHNEIREKRGLTYGVGAYLQAKDQADFMVGGLATANSTVNESISLIRAEWEKMRDAGVTQAELDRAKTYLTGGYPLRFSSNARIANILVGMQLDGLTPDYIVTRNDQVNAVTLEDVARVSAELMDPDALSFIVVGQSAELAN